ncbi:MAG: hypothetical protein QF412_08745 [Planctomycetota bacterium]|nr:hypothetical protein [Planctomycetota bacterium]
MPAQNPDKPEALAYPWTGLPFAWLIPILVVALWWPIGTYWQSDDWLAIHHAFDAGRALSDFTGNQYGLEGLVWFYRPMITLSFWADSLTAATSPFFFHFSNACAHGVSALLLAMIAHRLSGPALGWCAALVWAAAPLHAGSVLWTVGRVDSHAAPWCLLCALFVLRWLDGQSTRRPALITFVVALMTKEIALVLPGVAALLAFGLSSRSDRWRNTLRITTPFIALLALYLLWRWLLFGRIIGGYQAGGVPFVSTLFGFFEWTLRAVNPLWTDGAGGEQLSAVIRWAGFLPVLLGVTALLRRRRIALLGGILVMYLGCCIPMAQFWAHTDNLEQLRLLTLPFAVLALLIAAGGPGASLLALAIFALPYVQIRKDYIDTHSDCRRYHETLKAKAPTIEEGPLFVAGLPSTNAKKNVVAFHLGVDRMLQPPFSETRRRLLALRPLSEAPGTITIDYGGEQGLPGGISLRFDDPDTLRRLPPSSRATMEVAIDGPSHVTSNILWGWNTKRRGPSWFVTKGTHAKQYRITIFTARGYLSTILTNEAGADKTDGRVSVEAWLRAPYRIDPRDPARQDAILMALGQATTLDLETRFPVLVEAGEGGPEDFRTSKVAGNLIELEFDRDFQELSEGRVPDPEK